MNIKEFLASLPWQHGYSWEGSWGHRKLENGNVAKVNLSESSNSQDGRNFSAITVEIVNPTAGPIIWGTFRFADFLQAQDGWKIVPSIIINNLNKALWHGDHLPISCHPLCEAVEGFIGRFE